MTSVPTVTARSGRRTVDDHMIAYGRFAPDYQARSLYEAEERFHDDPPPGQERFATVREAAQWAAKLAATPEFAAAYPDAAAWLAETPVSVKRSSAKQRIGCAVVGTGEISLSSFDDGIGMVLPVMVHEFAHVVHGRSPSDEFQQPHGSEFAAVYLDMVALVCGDTAADRLCRDFDRARVGVDLDARRVVAAGDGLAAAGRLPRPSRRRTPESVAAARDTRFVKAAEKAAAKALKYRPGALRQFVELNSAYFKQAAECGADLPSEVLRHVPNMAQTRPVPAPRQQVLCGKIMPRARRRCSRPVRHRGGCR